MYSRIGRELNLLYYALQFGLFQRVRSGWYFAMFERSCLVDMRDAWYFELKLTHTALDLRVRAGRRAIYAAQLWLHIRRTGNMRRA